MNVSRYRKSLICNTVTMLLLTVAVHSNARAEGVVTATFKIDSSFFKSVLTPQTISEVEVAVAQSLANVASSRFPFLQWQPADNNQASGPQLELRMIDLPNGACDPQPTVNLQWFGVISAGSRALSDVDQYELYQTCDPDIPTQEPDRLQTDVVAAVSDMLKNSAVQKKILDQVLARVPFADELINHENKWLLLPVSAEQLLAGDGTEMLAKFNITADDDSQLASEMRLEPRYDSDGSVKVLILAILGPGLELQQGGAYWSDGLIDVLAKSSDMKLYMREYVQDPFAGQTVADTDVLSDL